MNLFTFGKYLFNSETICVCRLDCGKFRLLNLREFRKDRVSDPQQGQVP
ncbi:hypothetical protein SAMN06265380_11444 [Ruegeria faecimaris]|uniref:Uncharacterized protein n=1 Tax=Ruegeria faecimaris TaxID=686389 RepID=A0A521EWD4_9RHOB|nr:hypothetical protein SAMN06265380_11444 [Ruegeria faecimaris]